jgi:D-alanyl-D-alanine carboxypeptidase
MNFSGWQSISALIVAILLATGGCEKQQTASATSVGDRLQTLLESVVENSDSQIPGVILQISSSGMATWSGVAGLADMEIRTPLAQSDKFRAGSIMKSFVSVVILQLVEEGRVTLDTPITEMLPSNVTSRFINSDRITVRMLLNHTGGIAEWVTESVQVNRIAMSPRKVWQEWEQLEIAAEIGPSFAPGEGWAYSNTDYVLLGQILEQATGKTWREEVRNRIIEPLRLDGTSLPEPGNTEVPDQHARGYHLIDGKLVDLTEVDPSMAGAAGGHALMTTTADLIRFLDAVIEGRLFRDEKMLEEMLTFVDAPDEHGVPYYYGLGLEKYVFPGGIEMIGHAGSTAGFASVVYHVAAQGFTVSVAVNTQDLEAVYLKVLVPALEILAPSR